MTYCFNCKRTIFKQHWKRTMHSGGYWTCKLRGKS